MSNTTKFTITLDVNGKDKVSGATATVEQLEQAVKNAQTSVKGSLGSFNDYGFAMQGVQSAVSQLSSTLNSLTEESRAFGGAMAAANTMADKSGEDFDNLKAKVAGLAKEVPVARDALANGLYQVISNGVPEDNWIEYLRQSARSSVGGIADLEEVVKVTSTVIKNYGLAWSDAAEIQDKIQLTAKNGVTSFEQMAQALPRVTANAATLGVTVDELMASFATLTGVSGNTAEVSTQLAAIFTALIKPSSEAVEMAQQMGIQFDAAAIKAAGGMDNFLVSLNNSVKQYAQTSDMLEQEIYGKLFGSAESLRALTPLVGNLAAKYKENVGQMKESTGEMDKAYEKLGHTGAAQLTLLKNSMAGIADALNTVVGPALPILNITTQIGMSVMAVRTLAQGIGSLGLITKATSVVVGTFGPIVQVCSATMRGAAVSANTLKLAIRGLMVSTGVGVAIAVLTTVIEQLLNASDEAAGKTQDFSEAEQAYQTTAAQTKVSIDNETKKLRELIAAKKDTTQAVKDLNDKYGTVFGNHKTAADWYDTLTKKSQIYARQLGYEAQVKLLSTQLAEKQIRLQENYDKRRDLWKSGGAKQTTTRTVGTSISGATYTATYEEDTQAYKDLKDEARELIPSIDAIQKRIDIANQKMAECANQIKGIDNAGKSHNETLKVSSLNYNQIKEKIEEYQKKLGAATNDPKEASRLNGILKQLESRKKALEKTYSGLDTSGKKHTTPEPKFYKNPTTRQQYEKNINYYTGKLTNEDTAANQKIRENIKLWQQKVDLIDLATKKQAAPTEIKTHDDTQKVLEYLNFAHDKAAALGLDIQDINKKIAEVNLADAAIDRSPVLDSLTAIDNEIKYQQALKNTSSLEAQANIDKEIKKLEALKQKRTELQKLQDRLTDAQENFDNATTVEAKVEVSAELSKIQKEIDENTKGKLTVEADVEPTYIQQGSLADKRQSYSNAQQKASRVQQDKQMGIIDSKEAKRQIKEINDALIQLGIEPIKVKVDANEAMEAIGQLGSVSISSFDSVRQNLQALSDLPNTTAKGFAVAGDAAVMLGSAMQQLGADSDAAKAGMVMAAIGQVVLSFAQALASCKTWVEWLAFGISGTAQMISLVATISKFATGGIVGGNQRTGDNVLVRVNSGEMILNASQQARLFALANGAAVQQPTVNAQVLQGTIASQESTKKSVSLRLRGRDLVGSVANETRSNRKRSNIKI